MFGRPECINNLLADCKNIKYSFLLLFILCALPGLEAKAQATLDDNVESPVFTFDEIPVRVMIEGYKLFYIDAIYGNNKKLFVNVEDLFNTLDISCVSAQNKNSFSGFVETESRIYSIDYDAKQIKVGSKIIKSRNGFLKESGALYIETSLFAEAFGITLTFNYRTLTILLKSEFELPVTKQLRIEKLRSNLSNIKGEIIADTIVKREYHLLKLGTMDWSIASSQTWNSSTNTQMTIGLGTELLYGEADITLNYYDRQKFDDRQLQYLWRWVDNDKSIVKQAQVGKISNQMISFINAPVLGAVIRNTPTTVRKAKGNYTIHEFTEPNWSVELYINNVMVDYTKADASGLFQFKVPIVYGYSTLKLKFYGPLGEERTEERTMNVPYTVMPAKEFEYGLSVGMVQDSCSSRLGKAEFNYGVNRILTVGGGVEYLSSITNGPFIPYLTTTLQPFSKLTINGEYSHRVRFRGLVNYYFSRDILLEIDYSKYVEGQLATRFNAPEERKVRLSVPLRVVKVSGFAKLDYTQRVYKDFNYNQVNLLGSAYYQQISANSITQLNWVGNLPAYIVSDLTLSYRMKNGTTIRPSTQYNITENKLVNYKIGFEKYILRGNVALSFERNILYKDNFININFKYDLPFVRSIVSSSHSRDRTVTSESMQGSIAFGDANNYIYASNNSAVGKGGISIHPFLDLNRNGVFDVGEKLVKLTSVSIMGGRATFSEKDSILRIPNLNAFIHYLVEFQDKDLENISWRFTKKVYKVLIDPNQFKRIDVPIQSFAEVNGMAYIKKDNVLKGARKIRIKFYDKVNFKVVAETLSELDGYINYMGLKPGEYFACVDPEQLEKLEMYAVPRHFPVHIPQSFEGAIVDGLDFTLDLVKNWVPEIVKMDVRNEHAIDGSPAPILAEILPYIAEKESMDSINNKFTIVPDEGVVLQTGAFSVKSNAFALCKKLEAITDHLVTVVYEGGYYKVRVNGFSNLTLARQFTSQLLKLGIQFTYVPAIGRK